MRRWNHHRTRSKVALLLLINLVALVGGKYLALITIVKLELFGEAMALAKTPKKKLSKSQFSRTQPEHLAASPGVQNFTRRDGKPRSSQVLLHVIRRGETLSEIAHSYGISAEALRRANQLRTSNHVMVGETLRIPPREGLQDHGEPSQTLTATDRGLLHGVSRPVEPRPLPAGKTTHGSRTVRAPSGSP